MQTFFPYPDPRASAAVLDDRRLGKQRVETFQVLRALTWPTYGWKHHPVVRMWRGFVPALVSYGLACIDEWRSRGHADGTRSALLAFTDGREPGWDELHHAGAVQPWVGAEALHLSHRSALVRKEPEHYPTLPPAPTLGLLAGLCTPGTTPWVGHRAALPRGTPAPAPRDGTGAASGSVARQPSAADRLAMAQEADAEAEFRFVGREAATRARGCRGRRSRRDAHQHRPGRRRRATPPHPALNGCGPRSPTSRRRSPAPGRPCR